MYAKRYNIRWDIHKDPGSAKKQCRTICKNLHAFSSHIQKYFSLENIKGRNSISLLGSNEKKIFQKPILRGTQLLQHAAVSSPAI